jgi:hypothetical protein
MRELQCLELDAVSGGGGASLSDTAGLVAGPGTTMGAPGKVELTPAQACAADVLGLVSSEGLLAALSTVQTASDCSTVMVSAMTNGAAPGTGPSNLTGGTVDVPVNTDGSLPGSASVTGTQSGSGGSDSTVQDTQDAD